MGETDNWVFTERGKAVNVKLRKKGDRKKEIFVRNCLKKKVL